MKLLLAAMIAGLALAACAPVEDQQSKDGSKGKLVNETNYQVCGDSTVSNKLEGNWRIQMAQGNLKFVTTYTISNNYLRVTHDCDFDGLAARATVTSRANYSSFQNLTLLDTAHNEQSVDRTGYKMTCKADLTPGAFTYAYQGRCLALDLGNGEGTLLLVPVE